MQGEKKEPDRLRLAVDLYRGPFLDGFLLPNCTEFEHWVSTVQSTFERFYLEALDSLIDIEIAWQNYEQASRYALRYLETDDLAEEVHRKLIGLFALLGDRNAALQQYERCLAALERELGISPLPETRAVYQLVLEGRSPIPVLPAQKGMLKLPEQPGLVVPLLGREPASQRLKDALNQARAGHGNIVLISGEAGIGKSRLMRDFMGSVSPGVRVLYCSGYPGGQAIPYKPIVDAIRSDPGILVARVRLATSLVGRDIAFAPRTAQPVSRLACSAAGRA